MSKVWKEQRKKIDITADDIIKMRKKKQFVRQRVFGGSVEEYKSRRYFDIGNKTIGVISEEERKKLDILENNKSKMRAQLQELKKKGIERYTEAINSLDHDRGIIAKTGSEAFNKFKKFSDIPSVANLYKQIVDENDARQKQMMYLANQLVEEKKKLQSLNP